jgi:hypothetical protein
MSAAPSKRNLTGGKGHKRRAGKEAGAHQKNRLIVQAFTDDILEESGTEGVILARVLKAVGGARMQLITVGGKEIVAKMKRSLQCSKGAARRSDNPIVASAGGYVLLQEEDYAFQIIGVLSRPQVKLLETRFPDAPKGFFTEGGEEVDDGFDWDEKDEDSEVDIDKI